ncbi:multisubunit potassium/proton antiporter PhaG subunit [Rhodovulum imhoffii]|uniref:Multisubunit potassium/proton antiporter PhaG subunit n=1 Tax=Rhodovulum imhoffii TaxID=365340 RepID=A0A2T5BVI9_9RHOB|nr:Na+/H+ antiporter subunit G [Rhodovulum imhoffii]MBK5932834.1 Na+/H+ antiporter subunit G [Rhodovulum imhoffii]PTN03597.1 multisubunit potassium/proton antiporter PhaG subunit [Rhodovulum imhoffii]
MDLIADLLISFSLIVAGVFGLVGSFGLIKLRDPMSRLHGPTKATTLGVGGALVASVLYFLLVMKDFSFHELLITLFLFMTAPITAHFIAKMHIHRNERRDTLPATGTDRPWATFESDTERARAEARRQG